MTERAPARPPVEDRLATWFAGEVRRAQADVVALPARPRVPRRSTVPAGLLVATMAAIAIVTGVALRDVPGTAPVESSPGATGLGSHGPGSPPPAGIVLGADGIPSRIDGEVVLRGPAATARAADVADSSPFLVGGWARQLVMRCAAVAPPTTHPLLPPCGSGFRLVAAIEDNDGLNITPDGHNLPHGAVVVRVHVGDPRAATCPPARLDRCRAAIVVEAVVWQAEQPDLVARFADGIPSSIAGELVRRPAGFATSNLPAGESFLIGGWGMPTYYACPAIPLEGSHGSCAGGSDFADTPVGGGKIRAIPALPTGPVVVRAHTPLPEDCPSGCPAVHLLIVEEIVWRGDEFTAASPRSILGVATALDLGELTASHAAVECDPGFPSVRWIASDRTDIGLILVFPSTAAREAIDQNYRADGYWGTDRTGAPCATIIDAASAWRWVAVDNVMVQVMGTVGGTPAALDQVAKDIETRLASIEP